MTCDPFERCYRCHRPLLLEDGSDPGEFCDAACEAAYVLARAKLRRTLRAVVGAPAAALRRIGLLA